MIQNLIQRASELLLLKGKAEDADYVNQLESILNLIIQSNKQESKDHTPDTMFQKVFEASPLGVHIFQMMQDGQLIFFGYNKSADKILGVNHAQFIGKEICDAFPDLKNTEIPSTYKNVAQTGKIWESTNIIYKDNFISGCFDVVAFQPTPGYIVAQFQDITERKRTELALIEKEKTFRTISNNLQKAMIYQLIRKPDGMRKFTYVSDIVTRFHECTPEQVYENPMFIYNNVLKGDLNRVIEEEEEANKNLSSFHIEVEILTPSGKTRWSFFSSIPRYLEDGSTCWDGIEFDITDRKYEEQHLAQQNDEFAALNEEYLTQNEELRRAKKLSETNEEKYRRLVDVSPDGIIIHHKGIILFANTSAAKIIGFDHSENLIGKNALAFVHPDSIEAVKKRILEKSGYDVAIEEKFITKNGGTIYVEVIASIIEFEGKECFQTYIRDISHRKIAEQELIETRNKAMESDRLKSAFLANMSHEIRTPMNGILGFANLLLLGNISDEKKNHYLTIILNNSNQLLSIINDILDISRIEAGLVNVKSELFNLNSVINEVYEMFRPSANQKKLLIKTEIPDKAQNILSDKTKITQILSNLVSNAIKFTNFGEITIGCRSDQNTIEIYVSDTGIGIPADMHQLIFERFRQVEESYTKKYGGTGLGLAISKNLVEMLGGTISVKSETGKGSVFSVFIPVVHSFEKKIIVSSDVKQYNAEQLNNKTILIAEDEFINFYYLEELLRFSNAKIIHAINGIEAVEIALDPTLKPDMILMDIKMPEMNGIEATKKIREKNPSIPIIAQTAYSLENDRQTAIDAGCNDFIAKPVSYEVFFTILKYL